MHGSFHLDAFFIFLAMAFILTTLIRVLWNKTRRFVQHVFWMRRRSGGTLKKDAEANFWLKKIKDPQWRSIWRWFYAEEWKKKYATTADKKPKHRLLRGLLYSSAVLTILVIVLLSLGG